MTHPAYAVADKLKAAIEPACVRVEIAGSISRLKPEPKDVEIVCQPQIGVWTVPDMFGGPPATYEVNHLETLLGKLYESFLWRLDPENRKDGPNYKRLQHVESGIGCDVFIVTDRRKWGMIKTIRTGSSTFSRNLVTHVRHCGWFVQHGLLHQHQPELNELDEVQECPNGQQCPQILALYEEREVFDALGLPWIEPPERTTLIEALARENYRQELKAL